MPATGRQDCRFSSRLRGTIGSSWTFFSNYATSCSKRARMQEPHFLTMALAFLPVLYASCFVHELGHAVAEKSTVAVTSFRNRLGHMRPFCVIPIAGTRVFFCLERPRVGLTFAFPRGSIPDEGRTAAYLTGGIVANVGLVNPGRVSRHGYPGDSPIWLTVASVNAVLAVSSMVPFHIKAGHHGVAVGWSLDPPDSTFRCGRRAVSPGTIPTCSGVARPLDRDRRRPHPPPQLAHRVPSWSELEDFERAAGCLAEADGLPRPRAYNPRTRCVAEAGAMPPPPRVPRGSTRRRWTWRNSGRQFQAERNELGLRLRCPSAKPGCAFTRRCRRCWPLIWWPSNAIPS